MLLTMVPSLWPIVGVLAGNTLVTSVMQKKAHS